MTLYAVGSFVETMKDLHADEVTSQSVRHWIGMMLMKGMKHSTVKRYFGKMHSIYNDWVCGSNIDPFAGALSALNDAYTPFAEESHRNLELVKRLFSKNEKSVEWKAITVFLYLLYNVEATFLDVISLTFADVRKFCPQIDDIVEAQKSSFGRKYVFDFKQGKCRPSQIFKTLSADMEIVLKATGMKFDNGGFSRDSITSIWIGAAIEAGIDIPAIRSIVSAVPQDYAALSLVKGHDLTDSEREEIICHVANYINDNANRWFVMKLRNGVKIEDIKKRICDLLPERLNTMTLFYPVRGIVKRRGKRTVKDEEPYLPDLLFFKTQRYKVRSLFAAIGDLSWCFRTSGLPGSEYSVIPNKEMTRFQQCVGQFTPDVKMELMDIDRPLERGRKVRIVGGIMAGYEGEIIDVEGEPGMRMFFLKIANMTRAAWKVRVEDVFIEPLDN